MEYFNTRNEIIVTAFQPYILNNPTPTFKMNLAETKGEGIIPLVSHPKYGNTQIILQEKYDSNGMKNYHYGWEINITGGIQTRHIIIFGSEPHTKAVTDTEPYHHNHIPGSPAKRQACYTIRSLRDVLSFVIYNYIQTGNTYDPIQT